MLLQDIIAAKRDRRALSNDQIAEFVEAVSDGRASDAQIAALAMAIVLNGMSRDETVALTMTMAASGERLDWSGLGGPVVDKHSSGGIGDKVSLVLAPLLAACGAYVPMISGRGLGHTGGTLDKLESYAGYTSRPDNPTFRDCVRDVGCAIVGAGDRLAPADRRFYAVRDVTATVESLPLITASILSKKLAAGPSAMIMDVKLGSGAFCRTADEATALARSIVETANAAGLPTRALISDMNQCLGRTAGNALEVREALSLLRGEPADMRLHTLVVRLAGETLALAGLAGDVDAGTARAEQALASGQAFERFARMVAALGGGSDSDKLPTAPIVRPLIAAERGFVAAIDGRALGHAVIGLGGGRRRAEDTIDHAVGLAEVAGIGAKVGGGQPLCLLHARRLADIEAVEPVLRQAFVVTADPVAAPPLVYGRMDERAVVEALPAGLT